ncbi:MAG: hypothetical protein MUE85_18700 [Microscillaceae bacterium]|jgi:hypothetical protein|nr:hypothetical protein [Microscillaceae bacterium]
MATIIVKIKDQQTLNLVLEKLKPIEGIEIEEELSVKEQIRQGLKEVKEIKKGNLPKKTLKELLSEDE